LDYFVQLARYYQPEIHFNMVDRIIFHYKYCTDQYCILCTEWVKFQKIFKLKPRKGGVPVPKPIDHHNESRVNYLAGGANTNEAHTMRESVGNITRTRTNSQQASVNNLTTPNGRRMDNQSVYGDYDTIQSQNSVGQATVAQRRTSDTFITPGGILRETMAGRVQRKTSQGTSSITRSRGSTTSSRRTSVIDSLPFNNRQRNDSDQLLSLNIRSREQTPINLLSITRANSTPRIRVRSRKQSMTPRSDSKITNYFRFHHQD
jgi:hypothetical protein